MEPMASSHKPAVMEDVYFEYKVLTTSPCKPLSQRAYVLGVLSPLLVCLFLPLQRLLFTTRLQLKVPSLRMTISFFTVLLSICHFCPIQSRLKVSSVSQGALLV